MTRMRTPLSINSGVMASIRAVLPEPTGPPTPMREIFFMVSISRIVFSIHEHADARLDVHRGQDIGHRREGGHIVERGAGDALVGRMSGRIHFEQYGLGIE